MNVNKLRLKQYNTGEADITLRFHQSLTGGSSHFYQSERGGVAELVGRQTVKPSATLTRDRFPGGEGVCVCVCVCVCVWVWVCGCVWVCVSHTYA